MAKSKKQQHVEFPFFDYLLFFYEQNREKIRAGYNTLTKKFLDFNDPDKGTAFLRRPQFEALEIYVFLKEYLDNRYVYEIFEDWFYKQGKFEGRTLAGADRRTSQIEMFAPIEDEQSDDDKALFEAVYEQAKAFKQVSPTTSSL